MNKKVVLPLIFLCFSLLYLCGSSPNKFHTAKEMATFGLMADTLHEGYNGLFAASGDCEQCHGFDETGFASHAGKNGDVNVVDDWKTTMMAMSAKDPFWRAKVSHEVLTIPNHQAEIEDKCTSCHASMGHFAAFHEGAEHYSIEDLENDPWGLDGVSCLSCHQQDSIGLGSNHSGDLRFDTSKVAYGQYIGPLVSPMVQEIGYVPAYSEHISDAGICAGCHTLITETVDLEGEFIGSTFVEQSTYHEWLNSTYDDQDISCQNCHMPSLGNTPVFLITGLNTAPRSEFKKHEFAGANSFMLKLMKENKSELGLVGSDADFDETINSTINGLQTLSADLSLEFLERDETAASFRVSVNNLAGHKFPSGYPARRFFLQFKVFDAEGGEIFSSGETGDNFTLPDEEGQFEPHYEVINSEDQVQIYEMVMGDVEGNFTTVLDRGAVHLKDNRLLPIGFSHTDEVIDTVLVYGGAALDPDFMSDDAALGKDELIYEIPLNNYTGQLFVSVKAFYQSIPHKWLEEIFSLNSPEIDSFRDMYEGADKTPVLVASESYSLESYVGVSENIKEKNDFWEVIYNSKNQPVIKSSANAATKIYSINGALLHEGYVRSGMNLFPLFTPGIYIITSSETSSSLKLIVR